MLLVLATLVVQAVAEPIVYGPDSGGSIPPGDGCSEGVIPDDGTVEAGYGWSSLLASGGFVERFEAADFRPSIERICTHILGMTEATAA